MQTGEVLAPTPPDLHAGPQRVASVRHFAGFLVIAAGVVVLGILAQYHSAGNGGAEGRELAQHSRAVPIYLTVILTDWALLYYCWAGVHHYGGNLKTLSCELKSSWRSLATDVGIALPFWILWQGSALGVHWLLETSHLSPGASGAKTVESLLPRSPAEILLWIGASITAGICEELSFRGYVQRQFHALTGNAAMAVMGQGVVFGLFHAYQGWKNVMVICVLGVLFGVLAQWRRNLRTNILVHAWADVWAGWLKFVVWR